MFQDLDATLRAMLSDAAAPQDLRSADLSFETPDKSYAPGQTTVNLFLHDVAENRELRDEARLTHFAGGVYTIAPPPMRMDCTYLTTVWSAKAGGVKAAEEHRVLGLALVWLTRFSVIEERFLQGSLKTPLQLYPVPVSVAQTKGGAEHGAVLECSGSCSRPAFSVTATITVLQSYDSVEVPAAERFNIHMTSLPHPRLAGRVLDHALAPVAAAKVSVVGSGQQVTVSRNGHFSFTGLEFGEHTLLVQVAGHADLQVPVAYAARDQIHNVILPGP